MIIAFYEMVLGLAAMVLLAQAYPFCSETEIVYLKVIQPSEEHCVLCVICCSRGKIRGKNLHHDYKFSSV